MSAYIQLEDKFRDIGRLQDIEAVASWDEACLMPRGGARGRGESMAALAGLIHEKCSDPEIGELLNRARGQRDLSDWQLANLMNIERAWTEAIALPGELVRAYTHATVHAEQVWREARAANDWQMVAPALDTVVNLARQRADALAAQMGLSRYDALLDSYEADLRVDHIQPLFSELKAYLPGLLDRVLGAQAEPLPLVGPFPVEQQRALCEDAMHVLGFDFERGRFDVSHHPFCGGVPDDTRITTRYDERSFLESLMAICHETGHALYQQGLPVAWRNQPVGESLGAAVHESQSLLMELQVCRSREFIEFMAPKIRTHFAQAVSPQWSSDNLYAHATRVARGYIRVDADEITYPLHVILRFEMEQLLLNGELAVKDLPDAWDSSMKHTLGLSTAGNDADGCMQDVHWFAGLFGYFPTYTLGAVGAAQWFAAAQAECPEIKPEIALGNLEPLLTWLRRSIHDQGRKQSMQALLTQVTGETLNTRAFKAHLESRYLS